VLAEDRPVLPVALAEQLDARLAASPYPMNPRAGILITLM
jgi:hypothetical protein